MFALQSTTFTGCKVVAKTSMKSRRYVVLTCDSFFVMLAGNVISSGTDWNDEW